MRVTSPPSARPRVSRMTWPTMTPIGFMSPARRRSAMSGLASRAAWTAGSSVSAPPMAPSPSASTIARRVAALGHEPVEDLLGPALRDLLLAHEPDERGQRPGRHLRLGRVLHVDARDELVDPVGQRLGLDAVARQGGLEVVAQLGAPRQQPGRVRRQPEVALETLGARGRQLGQRHAGALEHRLADGDRDEVGLGEVAVVVRLLLGAQRRDRLGPRIEVQGLLLDLAARAHDRPPGARSRPGSPSR